MVNIFSSVDLKQSFYENAFNSTFRNIWQGTPAEVNYQLMAFAHSHLIFLRDNLYSEFDRRKLLYYYNLPFMSADSSEDSLNKLLPILPSNNLYVKRVLRAICSVYDTPPTREFANEAFGDVIKEVDLDNSLMQAHELAKLVGEVIVRPFYVNGLLSFEVVAPDRYNYVYRNDRTELWLQSEMQFDGLYRNIFLVWTDSDFTVFDDSMKNVTTDYIRQTREDIETSQSVSNPYGIIPYVTLRLNGSKDGVLNGLWELIRSQLDYNRFTLLETKNAVYNGFSMMSFINYGFEKGDIKLGADMVYAKDDVTDDMGFLPPTYENIAPESQYTELNIFKNENIKNSLFNFDMPNSMINSDNSIQSGVAMRIERQGLDEYRRQDIEALRAFEKELLHLTAVVLDTDSGSNFGDIGEISIEYNEQPIPTDPESEYNVLKDKFENGLISLQKYVNSVSDIDNIASDNDAFNYIKDNLDMLNKIKGLRDVRATATETNGIDGATTNGDAGDFTRDFDGGTE